MTNSIILQNIDPDALRILIGEVVTEKLQSFSPKPQKQLIDPYLTRREVADLLRISLPTLHMLVNTEKLKCYSIKGRRLFKKSEVEGSLITLGAAKYRR